MLSFPEDKNRGKSPKNSITDKLNDVVNLLSELELELSKNKSINNEFLYVKVHLIHLSDKRIDLLNRLTSNSLQIINLVLKFYSDPDQKLETDLKRLKGYLDFEDWENKKD